jgi:hypothetical protein
MVEVAQQEVVNVIRAHLASHAGRRARDHGFRLADLLLRTRPVRQLVEHGLPGGAADLDDKAMLALPRELGKREIVTAGRLWPGPHRRAETGAAGDGTVDRDDEDLFAPAPIVRIDPATSGQDAVLDGDGMEIARPHADEGEAFFWQRLGHDLDATLPVLGAPEPLNRRMEKFLPGMRPDGVAEDGVVVAAAQAVTSAVLLVRPGSRQVAERGDIVIDDRLARDGWAEDAVAAPTQRLEQGRQSIFREHGMGDAAHAPP